MKQSYTKPMFSMEMFSVMQAGARVCSDSIPFDQVTSNDINTCHWNMGGIKMFIEQPNCDMNGEEMGVACYNNPAEGMYIFRS